MVQEFHERFGLTINDTPTLSPKDDALRIALIREELDELKEGITNDDRVEIADALADLRYVILGAGVTYGFALDPMFVVPVTIADMELRLTKFDRELKHHSLPFAHNLLDGLLEDVEYLAGAYTIPLDAVFQEVHRSNMSKLWTDAEIQERNKGFAVLSTEGGVTKWTDGVTAVRVSDEERSWLVKRADGKALKSPSYSPADIAGVLPRN